MAGATAVLCGTLPGSRAKLSAGVLPDSGMLCTPLTLAAWAATALGPGPTRTRNTTPSRTGGGRCQIMRTTAGDWARARKGAMRAASREESMSLTCNRGVDSLGVDFEVLLALALLRRGGRPRSFRIAAEAPRSDAAAQAPGRGRHLQRVSEWSEMPRSRGRHLVERDLIRTRR